MKVKVQASATARKKSKSYAPSLGKAMIIETAGRDRCAWTFPRFSYVFQNVVIISGIYHPLVLASFCDFFGVFLENRGSLY